MYKISFYQSADILTEEELKSLSVGEMNHALTPKEYGEWLSVTRNHPISTMTVLTEEDPETVKKIFNNSGYVLLAQGTEFDYE